MFLAAVIFAVVIAWVLLRNPRGPENQVYKGKTMRVWTEQMRSPKGGEREQAIGVFKELGESAVPALTRLAGVQEPVVRKRLWPVFAKFPGAVPKLLAPYLKPPSVAAVRFSAIEMLGLLGAQAQGAVPVLAEIFRNGPVGMRYHAALSLGKIGGRALPVLLDALNQPNLERRRSAAEALGESGIPGEKAMAPLMKCLDDENDIVRHAALESLGKRGPELLPQLVTMLKSGDVKERVSAARVLGSFRPVRNIAQPPLLEMASDPSAACRVQALKTLGTFSLPNRMLVDAFCMALKDPVPEVRAAAAIALTGTPRMTLPAVPDLVAALRDPAPEVRASAAQAVAVFGSNASLAMPGLHQLEADTNEAVRDAATQAIARLEVDLNPEL